MDAGWGVDRRLVMHNYFQVVGPKSDAAGIRGMTAAADGFRKIAAAGATFVSRGDGAGTAPKELGLRKPAGIPPTGTAADLPAFHTVYTEPAQRDHFIPRPLRYFERMVEVMSAEDDDRIRLYLTHHEGDLVAATTWVRVGHHTWYSYGASTSAKREVQGSTAIQWRMMSDAIAAGADVYDLRGITDTIASDDPHLGLIRFKVGTGGEAVEYAGEWDLPLRPSLHKAFGRYMKRRG